MTATKPQDEMSPKSRFRAVRVLYNRTIAPFTEISVAEIEMHDGSKSIGILDDRKAKNQENGYASFRGKSWLLIPEPEDLLPILNAIFDPAF